MYKSILQKSNVIAVFFSSYKLFYRFYKFINLIIGSQKDTPTTKIYEM